MGTELRKVDHLRLVVDRDVEHPATTLLESVLVEHLAAPEVDYDEADTRLTFLGKTLEAPIMVAGMTGGHPVAERVNCDIASVVEELGLAMGVGSQRAALERPSPEVVESFRAARRCAPTAPLVANVGFAQVATSYGARELVRAVEMIDADALAIHLNPGQEVAQPEGDRRFRGFVEKLERLLDELPVPVIVKETGHGIGYSVALTLSSVGVRYFDVSGAGGTSWIRVEAYRAAQRGDEPGRAAAEAMAGWGIPTALSIVEVRWAAPHACIIASGGIRSAMDAVRALALGADLVGLALPVLRAYSRGGRRAVRTLLESVARGVRMAMVLTGSRSLDELRAARVHLLEPLRGLVEASGIDLKLYMSVRAAHRNRC